MGQERAITQLKNFADSGSCPNMILYGPFGTGKTSAALTFAHSFLGDNFSSNFKMLNIRDVVSYPASKAKRDIQTLAKLDRSQRSEFDEYMSIVYREVKNELKIKGISREPNRSQILQTAIKMYASTIAVTDESVKILVLDEADALTNAMQQALRRTLEIYSNVCRFVFITPSLSGWSPAILSRCVPISFPSPPEDSIRELIQSIATKESVAIEPDALKAIARESRGDMRRAINLLQIAAAYGTIISEDNVYQCSESPLTKSVRRIMNMAIDRKFVRARKELRNLLALEGYSAKDLILEMERDIVTRPFEPVVLARVLDRLGEIDYRVVQSRNDFLQITAFLASIGRIASEVEGN